MVEGSTCVVWHGDPSTAEIEHRRNVFALITAQREAIVTGAVRADIKAIGIAVN